MVAGQTKPLHSEIESRSSEPSDGTVADRPTRLDVHAQSALLREAFKELDPSEGETSAPASSPKRNGFLPRFGRRTLKSALGLAIVVIAGVGPAQRLLEYSSVEALVNAPLITIRAPIDGKIEDAGFASTIGESAPKGLDLLRISNTRADRGRLDD